MENFISGSEMPNEIIVSGKTAITRTSISAPLRFAVNKSLISGKTINFGSGKASHDSKMIRNITGSCVDYDINHENNPEALKSTYDTVFSAFVINVNPPGYRKTAWKMIANLTNKDSGIAVIAVRSVRDSGIKLLEKTGIREADGFRTKTGTFQIGFSRESISKEGMNYFNSVTSYNTNQGFEFVICKSPKSN